MTLARCVDQPGVNWSPAVALGAPPRWDGHVVVGSMPMAWFYGDLVAQWLGARGIYLDVCKIYERYELLDYRVHFGVRYMTPGAPLLFDTVAAVIAPVGSQARHQGHRLLLSVDDDVWHVPPWHRPRRDAGDSVILPRVESWLREADAVIVPSNRMAERVQPFAPEPVVIPPTLPRRAAWPGRRPPHHETGLRIGWVGTSPHLGDLECIGPAVLALLARHPAVTFVLGGQCVPAWATGHPRVEIHSGWWLLPAYYRFVASLDLDAFVCPLEATPFNAAKPCLKPLEAAMLGIPVIASRVGAYAEDLEHEATALLVENTTEAWFTALTRLVEDADLRAHLSTRGLEWAATRTIDSTGPIWARLWTTA